MFRMFIQLPSADPPPCPNVRTIGVAVVQNRFSASWAGVPPTASSAAGAHSFPRGPYSAYKVNYKMQSKTKRNARQFWKRSEVFLYMFSCLSHCNEKQNGMPDNFQKNWLHNETNFTPIGTILTHIGTILTSFGDHFDPIGDQRRKIQSQLQNAIKNKTERPPILKTPRSFLVYV